MDYETFLIILLSTLVINISIITVYVVLVLKDLRETLKKLNSVLDDSYDIVHNVLSPISLVSGLFNSISNYFNRSEKIRSIRR